MPDTSTPLRFSRLRTRPVRIRQRHANASRIRTNRIVTIALDLVIAVALFFIAFNANTDAIGVTPFHPDETRWLNRSYFIEDYADPYGSTWQDYYLTRGQPPLGSYVIGIGQWVQGGSLHPNLVWDFFYGSSNWNQIAGAMPDDADLTSGRRTSAFMGGLAVVLAYYVTRRLTNPVGGAVAGFLLAWNGLSIRIGSQALSDQTLLVCLALSFLLAFQFMRRPTWPWAIALGTAFGLGGAAKLTPLLLSLAAAGIGGLLLFRWIVYPLSKRDRRIDLDIAIKLLLQPLIAFIAFVVAFPYLWTDPIRRTWNLFDFRIREMDSQGQVLNNARVDGILDALNRMGNRYNLGEKQQTSWKIVLELNDRFDWTIAQTVGLDLMVAAAAVPFVIALALKHGLRSPHFLVVTLLAAEAAMIVYGLKSDLYRYYLPIVLIMFISVGIMVGMLTGAIGGLIRRLARRSRPASRRTMRPPTVLTTRLARHRRPINPRRRSIHTRLRTT